MNTIFIQLSWHVRQCLRLSRFVQAELNGNIKGLVAMMLFVQTKSEMRACIANDERRYLTQQCCAVVGMLRHSAPTVICCSRRVFPTEIVPLLHH